MEPRNTELRLEAGKPIDPRTRLSELLYCHRAIVRSEAGSCAEGVIVKRGDPRALLVPDSFLPLADRIG